MCGQKIHAAKSVAGVFSRAEEGTGSMNWGANVTSCRHALQPRLRKRTEDTASRCVLALVQEVFIYLISRKIKDRFLLTLRCCCDFTKMD